MSLIKSSLQSDLLSHWYSQIYTNKEWCDKLSQIVEKYVKSSTLTSTDKGSVGSGSYNGATNGSPTVDYSIMSGLLTPAIENMGKMNSGGDEYMALHLSKSIDAMMKEIKCLTPSVGVAKYPGPSTSPMSSPNAFLSWMGDPSTLEQDFLKCFKSMLSMSSGGDEYLAKEMAAAIDKYLKAATINLTFAGPVMGAGTGSLS